MLENILDSRIKIRIVKLFAEKNESFQVSDVARMLRISKSRASECLKELAEKGILESKIIGRSTLYKLSPTDLAKTVCKAVTQEKALLTKIERTVITKTKNFKPVSIALFGSALKGLKMGSDVDFLFLYEDDLEKDKMYETVGKLTEEFGFHISIFFMNVDEFRIKAKKGEEFVLNILANHKLLYGKNLERVVWQD